MEEKLIEYETAKLAKERGFDINNGHAYFNVNGTIVEGMIVFAGEYENLGFAPTQELLKKWLRLKYRIHISIGFDDNVWEASVGGFTIPDFAPDQWVTLDERGNYKESLEAYETIFEMALVVALKLIKL